MAMPKENDGPFECVLRNTENVDTFVDEFFSFLARRTDFFMECPPEGGSYGFPKGHAEKFILSKFHKWKSFKLHGQVSEPASYVNVKDPTRNIEPKISNPSDQSKVVSPSPSKCKTDSFTKKVSMQQTNLSSEAYNGKVTEKYTWSQTITDLDVKVPVKVKKGKDVKVSIESSSIRVSLATAESEQIFEGKLTFPIVKDESYWNLSPGESVNIWLQKEKERWWTALIEGEEPLDIKSIEAVRPMEELREEEQMKIQELMWNQERKQMGLPTSDEMKLQETLKKSWNLEGSPFKGQPFDPSLVNFSNT